MKKYFYVITIQFLGYRFHGWQKQPNVKTLHLMVDRTLKFILEDKYFKSLSSGRTDAMVSAESAAFELFLKEPIEDQGDFLELFNYNLPQDIRALHIKEVETIAKTDYGINYASALQHENFYGVQFHPEKSSKAGARILQNFIEL